MKKGLSYLLILAMLLAVFTPTADTSAAKKLKVSKKNVTVRAKESVKVKYVSAKKPKAVSKDKKIATVAVKKKLIITGVKKGKTKIVVKALGKTATIKVTVKKAKAADAGGTTNKEATNEPKTTAYVATPGPTMSKEEAINMTVQNMDQSSVSANKFSFNTFNALRKNDGNSFASPFSLYLALSMLANGAEGNTKTELLNALGISDLNRWNKMAPGVLYGNEDAKVTLNIANSAWIGNTFETSPTIDEDFITPLEYNYNAKVKKNVQMDSMDTVNEINKWAEDNTNGLIKELYKEPLPAQTAMILANAVYFLGEWSTKFNKDATFEKEFNGASGKSNVQMMTLSSIHKKYIADDKFVGLELPYGNSGRYAMDILMSADASTTAGNVWEKITVDEQLREFAAFDAVKDSKKISRLELPKFELECNYSDDLITALKNMGVKDVFNYETADLSKIGKDHFVNGILQKTKIKVDENGTEAAAVTAIADAMSAMPRPEETVEFIVDRPFIFAIRDTATGLILFIGEVNDL